jgi:hypothetical protein
MYYTESSGSSESVGVADTYPKSELWSDETIGRRSIPGGAPTTAAEALGAGGRITLMFLAPFVIAVPLLAVALASSGVAAALGSALVATWVALTVGGLHAPWAKKWLHLAGGLFVVLTLALLPFNSLAFVFDFWAAVVMFVSSASRQRLVL